MAAKQYRNACSIRQVFVCDGKTIPINYVKWRRYRRRCRCDDDIQYCSYSGRWWCTGWLAIWPTDRPQRIGGGGDYSTSIFPNEPVHIYNLLITPCKHVHLRYVFAGKHAESMTMAKLFFSYMFSHNSSSQAPSQPSIRYEYELRLTEWPPPVPPPPPTPSPSLCKCIF